METPRVARGTLALRVQSLSSCTGSSPGETASHGTVFVLRALTGVVREPQPLLLQRHISRPSSAHILALWHFRPGELLPSLSCSPLLVGRCERIVSASVRRWHYRWPPAAVEPERGLKQIH